MLNTCSILLRRYFFSVLFLAALGLSACSKPEIQKLSGSAQGTTYHISFWSTQAQDLQQLHQAIEQEFATLDKLLSNYRDDSEIELFNGVNNTETQTVNPAIVELASLALKVSILSQGCYDITIKPLFELWGFRGDHLTLPSQEQIDSTMQRVGMAKLNIPNSTQLQKRRADLKIDLSSIAQGYSVERISQLLENFGIKNYLVEIGGELKVAGSKPDQQAWRVAIEKPLPGSQQNVHKILTLPIDKKMAVMTSGTYRHYFDDGGKSYSHILDARSGRPISHNSVSVTVLHENPTLADAWSTTLLCLGSVSGLELAKQEKIKALFIDQNNQTLQELRSEALIQAKDIIIQ